MANPDPTPDGQNSDPDLEMLDEWFTYHSPKDNQPRRYAEIRGGAHALAAIIIRCCPRTPDRTVALRHIRDAVMNANASIAIGES